MHGRRPGQLAAAFRELKVAIPNVVGGGTY
jgi:hypothetical protein